ncbi:MULTISPECIES: hypothetical protein [Arthrobacter]|uniref:Uncharacterized protein n=2 Tax=Arthrobacter TaxID=1663 RepID=A0ABU9KHG0_9MICC|nr:hypothetical protein [Arthrobacter sp. YJM1]MDP5226649.1 hypothetical protein [Arthrobacter sp. YJM1]
MLQLSWPDIHPADQTSEPAPGPQEAQDKDSKTPEGSADPTDRVARGSAPSRAAHQSPS